MKNLMKRHRAVVGIIAAILALCVAVIYMFVLPSEAHTADGVVYYILVYGHSACWVLICMASVLWTIKKFPGIMNAALYAALAIYALFIIAIFFSRYL